MPAKPKSKQEESSLQWHFPDLQHADSEGLNDPLLQYFGGSHNWYIAREVIQNSIDARLDPEKPVVVRFEKLSIPTEQIPGVAELKRHLEVCLQQAKDEQNEKAQRYYADAVAASTEPRTIVLRAGDYNTSGLGGGDRDKKGKWHRLVRAVGENQLSGVGGGSYGIGKGAPFVASRMRAVYYSTRNETGEAIFQGKARLMSHALNGAEYRGVGSFGVKGYESVREEKMIPSAFLRAEQGTDINIIAYNTSLVWADELIESVLNNFWMAVYAGDLEVIIAEGLKETRVDRVSLRELLEKHARHDGLIFYRTVVDSTRSFEKQLPLLGLCRLFIRIEERFPRKLAMMRRSKMRVDEWKFPKTLQEPYAGVFVCDDPEGNLILRGLEPPEHDKWDPALDPANGKQAIDEIREWIRGSLLELAEDESGDPEEIPELEKFLPYDEDSEKLSDSHKLRSSPTGTAGSDESAMEVGAEREEEPDEIEEFVRKPSAKKESDGEGSNQRTHTGKGSGEGSGSGEESGLRGITRVNTSNVKFRIIYAGRSKKGNAEYCVILDPLADQEGAISIVALGEDSAVYPVPIAYAEDWQKSSQRYQQKSSLVEGLKLKKGKVIRIRLGTQSGSRYALGVENHES